MAKTRKNVEVEAHYADILQFKIPLPDDKHEINIEDIYINHGTCYVTFNDGDQISTDNYVWREPDYSHPIDVDWSISFND